MVFGIAKPNGGSPNSFYPNLKAAASTSSNGNPIYSGMLGAGVVGGYPNSFYPNGLEHTSNAPFAFDAFVTTDLAIATTSKKLRLLSTALNTTSDYVPYLYSRPVKTDRINEPTHLEFALVPYDASFVKLVRGNYIKFLTHSFGVWFSGYITNDPELERLGTENGKAVYGYKYTATSDDYILNLKPIGILPPFLNMTQGDILKALVEQLAPEQNFDLSNIQPGIFLARYTVDTTSGVGGATKYFSDIVKEFADVAGYRWMARDNVLYFMQQDAVSSGLTIDGNDPDFTPSQLKLTPSKDPILNDAIVVGDLEPQAHMVEYFVGDGFTTKFPLISSVFGVDSTVYVDDDFGSSAIDSTKWDVFDDPQNYLQVYNGYLNALGGRNDGSYGVYLSSVVQVPLEGHLRVTHGEYDFVQASDGVVGGLWTNPPDQVTLPTTLQYQLVGSGQIVGGTSDQFNFLSESVTSDSTLTARLASLSAGKAGLMYRNSTAANDVNIAVFVTGNSIGVSYRSTQGGDTKVITIAAKALPQWLRIVRTGNAFIPYYSENGQKWIALTDSIGISAFASTAKAGMFVSAETNTSGAASTTTATALFDNVSLPVGALSDADVGSPATAGSYSNPAATVKQPLTGCLYGIKATKSGGNTILNPMVNGVVDGGQSLTVNYNYRYILRTVYRFPNPVGYSQNYAYMDSTGQIVQLGNYPAIDGTATFQTWLTAVDPNTGNIVSTSSWTSTATLSADVSWANYCPVALNDLHCTMTGVTVAAPLQASLEIEAKGSSAWIPQLIGPNEMDSFDGMAPVATIVDANSGAVTRSSKLGRLQFNAGSPALEFFYDSTKQTQFLPQVGDLVRVTYSRAGLAIARVQDKSSVAAEAAAWGDSGLRSIIRRDFSPSPRTSAECELAAQSLVGDMGRQHWDGSYSGHNLFSFTAEPLTGTIIAFQNLPSDFPATLTAESIQEVKTTFVAISPQETFEHKIQFGRKDGLKKTLALFTKKQDVMPQQDTAEIPEAIDVSGVGLTYAPDVLSPKLVSWDSKNLYYQTGQDPVSGFEIRYTDESWGADLGKNFVTRTTTQAFTVPRTTRGRLIFVRGYDARNILLYSEDFTNAAWALGTGVSASNSTLLNPDENLSLISALTFAASGDTVSQVSGTTSTNLKAAFSVSLKGRAGDSYILKLVDSTAGAVIATQTVTMDGYWQRVTVSGTATSAMTGKLKVIISCNTTGGSTLYATRASLETGTLAETIYCKTLATPYGALSRYAAGVRSALPMIPSAPTATVDYSDPVNPVITITLPQVQEDVWGYEIRYSDQATVVHREDLSQVLDGQAITYTVAGNKAAALDFYVYCYNLLGEYSSGYFLSATIPAPAAPVITSPLIPVVGGFQFGFTQDNTQNPVVHSYKVYRSTSSSSSSAQVSKVISNNPANNGGEVVVEDLPGGDTQYWYWVSAVNGLGLESSLSFVGSGNALTTQNPFGHNLVPNPGFEINEINAANGTLDNGAPIMDGWKVYNNSSSIFSFYRETTPGTPRSGDANLLIRVNPGAALPPGQSYAIVCSTSKIPVLSGDIVRWKVWSSAAENAAYPSGCSGGRYFGLMVFNSTGTLLGFIFGSATGFGAYTLYQGSAVIPATMGSGSPSYVQFYLQTNIQNNSGVTQYASGLICDARFDDVSMTIQNGSFDVAPALTSYTPNSQPLSASSSTSAQNQCTIHIAQCTVTFPDGTKVYNAGSIGGLLNNTKYYVYCSDPTYSGGAVTYHASTSNPTLTSDNSYIFMGVITTPVFSTTSTGTTSGSGGGGGPCFSPNTLVETQRGLVPISEIKPGEDLALTLKGWRRIAMLIHHRDVDLPVRHMGNGEYVTLPHRFYQSGEWVMAQNIFTDSAHYKGDVFNLMIDTDDEDERNYTLANGWLVHNVIK